MSQSGSSELGSAQMEGSGIRPTRFNGKTSFSAWKLKTLAYLQSLGLKDVVVNDPKLFQVEGIEKKSKTIENAEHNAKLKNMLMKKSEKAYSILLNLLEDELTDLVATVETGDAFRVWFILLETYESKSTASVCHKLDLLMNIKFNPEKETFDMFKARFMKLLKELKDMDESVSPSIQRYVLLRSLPPKFEALVQSLKINDTIEIEEVYTHIKDYCELNSRPGVGNRERNIVPGDIAAILRDKKKFRCFCCGSKKHKAKDCPDKDKKGESDPDEDNEVGSKRNRPKSYSA